jgi:hypothetical protein
VTSLSEKVAWDLLILVYFQVILHVVRRIDFGVSAEAQDKGDKNKKY